MRKKLGIDRVSIYCVLESESMSDDNKDEIESEDSPKKWWYWYAVYGVISLVLFTIFSIFILTGSIPKY